MIMTRNNKVRTSPTQRNLLSTEKPALSNRKTRAKRRRTNVRSSEAAAPHNCCVTTSELARMVAERNRLGYSIRKMARSITVLSEKLDRLSAVLLGMHAQQALANKFTAIPTIPTTEPPVLRTTSVIPPPSPIMDDCPESSTPSKEEKIKAIREKKPTKVTEKLADDLLNKGRDLTPLRDLRSSLRKRQMSALGSNVAYAFVPTKATINALKLSPSGYSSDAAMIFGQRSAGYVKTFVPLKLNELNTLKEFDLAPTLQNVSGFYYTKSDPRIYLVITPQKEVLDMITAYLSF